MKGGVGLRLRVRRRRRRAHVDGRADDDLQHVHRGRRARRLRQPRRRRRSSTCAAGRSRRRARPSTRPSRWWTSMASDADARYDDEVDDRRRRTSSRRSPGASTPGSRSASARRIPPPATSPADERAGIAEALAFMGFEAGAADRRARTIDVAFIGSCTNGRLSDLREAARVVARPARSRRTCGRWSCPGSQAVRAAAEREGLRRGLPARPASSGAGPAARCAWR